MSGEPSTIIAQEAACQLGANQVIIVSWVNDSLTVEVSAYGDTDANHAAAVAGAAGIKRYIEQRMLQQRSTR